MAESSTSPERAAAPAWRKPVFSPPAATPRSSAVGERRRWKENRNNRRGAASDPRINPDGVTSTVQSAGLMGPAAAC